MARLTVKQLQALSAIDAGKRLSDEHALYGVVRTRGDAASVMFRWRYRFGGQVKDYTCGTWPKDSLAQIRQVRADAAAYVSKGLDPTEQARTRKLSARAVQAEELAKLNCRIAEAESFKSRLSVRALFDRWERLELSARKDAGKEARRSFEKDVFPSLGDVAAEDVTRPMVAQVLDNVVERGARILARNLLGDIRQMYGFAIVRGLVTTDPSSHMKRDDFGKKVERSRVLSEDEVRLLKSKLSAARMAKTSELAVWIILATCCRVGELSMARWDQIDLEKGVWRIPPEDAKNGKEHTVFLSDFAVDRFKELRDITATSFNAEGVKIRCPWVLPSHDKSNHLCLKSLAKQIGDRQRGDRPALSNRSSNVSSLILPRGKWTPHDLRRTGATLMGMLGIRPDVIEKCLNHVQQNRLVRIYQRQDLALEQKNAWRSLGELLDLLGRDNLDDVTSLPRVPS